MKVYNYDRETGEFLSIADADESQVDEGEFLIPAFATELPPPAVTETEKAVLVGGSWQIQAKPEPVVEAPPPPPSLAEVKAFSVGLMYQTYLAKIQLPVTYLGKSFSADLVSQDTVSKSLSGMGGVAPAGFYWVAEDNTQVPMTFAEVQGLAAVMFAQGWAAFQNLQNKKATILSAVDAAAVAAVVW